MNKILSYYKEFRIDNPLVEFGDKVYQPKLPINTVYDTFGAPLGMLRGLFEYIYTADGITLIPHIPPAITRIEQKFPACFGGKQIFVAAYGTGAIARVWVNGDESKQSDPAKVVLAYDKLPDKANVVIALGSATPEPAAFAPEYAASAPETPAGFWDVAQLYPRTDSNVLPLRIGADSEGKNNFVGDIQRVRIFNRALAPANIEALAKGENVLDPNDASLVSDWTLDRRNGANFANAVTGGSPAKLVGRANIIGGPKGKTLRLNGSAYLEVMHDPRLSVEKSMTIEAWIAPEAMQQCGGRIVDKVTAGKQDGFLFDTFPGNSLRLITPLGEITFDAKLPEAEWVHVAATCTANVRPRNWGRMVERRDQVLMTSLRPDARVVSAFFSR